MSALMVAVTLPALAHGPLDGRWALDLADCTEDRPPTDIVHGNEIHYYESVCVMRDVEEIGSSEQMWRTRLACKGEGEEWDGGDVIFALEGLDDGAARRLIEFDLGLGTATIRENCSATGE